MRSWLRVLVVGAVATHGCGGKTGALDGSGDPSAGSAGGTGGSSDSGTTASASGAATTNEGFYCPYVAADDAEYCSAGQQCVRCIAGEDSGFRCVPSQARDPDGFTSATVDCNTIDPFTECDGPEDCREGEYCVLDGGTHCANEPLFGSCCIYCDAPPQCTYCSDDEDCGELGVCMEELGLGEGVGACARRR